LFVSQSVDDFTRRTRKRVNNGRAIARDILPVGIKLLFSRGTVVGVAAVNTGTEDDGLSAKFWAAYLLQKKYPPASRPEYILRYFQFCRAK